MQIIANLFLNEFAVMCSRIPLILFSILTASAALFPDSLRSQEIQVLSAEITLEASEYDALQPSGGFFPQNQGPPPALKPYPNGAPREAERNQFGMSFPYAVAKIRAGSNDLGEAAIRYAGDFSYFMSANGLKRPMSVDFGRFKSDGPKLHGVVSLHSGGSDPSKLREFLSFSVFEKAGLRTPKVSLVEVTLTVPGKFEHAVLGLYTVVESLDAAWMEKQFGEKSGLVMKPARMRGIDYLGDDWSAYVGTYQPQSEVTPDSAKKVIAFAKLINQASADQFRTEIGTFLDVDQFLKFMAANAVLVNLDSFFGSGANYFLVLNPKTETFEFVPDSLESSIANSMFVGQPDDLVELSIAHPYAGNCVLAERVLAIDGMKAKYEQIVRELIGSTCSKENWLKQVASLESVTKEILSKESAAVAERKEPNTIDPTGGMVPQAPDLRNFIEDRLASIRAQLDRKNEGYVPQPTVFGPPPRANQVVEVSDATIDQLVQAPAEFEVTLYAAPPNVGYPVAIAAAPTGEVFIASDPQGSLGRDKGYGKIIRCVDSNNDGKADQFTEFTQVDHPRGVLWSNGLVYVCHPPFLTVFKDTNGDGIADESKLLVKGLTTELVNTRGGDHTTNGIRMGADGWIYIGCGDYGVPGAEGVDGSKVALRGGGILRVRPDGTEVEIFAMGLRNPFDIAIDPYLNLFTRDNTNDGAGWDVRVSQLYSTANYGYTQLFKNFTEETMPALGSFGGGGGTGSLYVEHPSWPAKFNKSLYTSDWGTSGVYRHPLTALGATFSLTQEDFVSIPRATGMDIDIHGRLIAGSWKGGDASVYLGPNVGFIAQVAPKSGNVEPFADLTKRSIESLAALLRSESSVVRHHAQREFIRRGKSDEATKALEAVAASAGEPIPARVLAIFALKQLHGKASHAFVSKLTRDAAVREFALRALADRASELDGVDPTLFREALSDANPRVRAQAIVGLSRLRYSAAAGDILPLASRPSGSEFPTKRPVQNQPDADRVIPHLAMRSLIELNAIDECLGALEGPHHEAALRTIRYLHDSRTIDGLVKKLATCYRPELRRELLGTLVRLYYREPAYDGSWWGIRPENQGPFYAREAWSQTDRIGAILTNAASDADQETLEFLRRQLRRHRVSLPGIPTSEADEGKENTEKEIPIVVAKADPSNPNQIGNLKVEDVMTRALGVSGDIVRGKELFASRNCRSCHTDADGQTPKGPHLADIGKRAKPNELLESILKPSAKMAQGFETYLFEMENGKVFTGFIASESADAILIRQLNGMPQELRRSEIEAKTRQEKSSMPDGIADSLSIEQVADLLSYLQSLR